MVTIVGPPATATRNRAITDELKSILEGAADTVGVDTVKITSGGQTSSRAKHLKNVPGGWTGSTRHDNGRAADLQLIKGGSALTFTDQDGGSDVEGFVTAAAALGATGIGAAVGYMGNRTIHVGFGTSPTDTRKLVWGVKGKSANAPVWLRKAAEEGWDNPVQLVTAAAEDALAARTPGRFVVIARGGLRLRNGAGLAFDATRTLNVGTELAVLGFDGPGGEWARVDLEDDGLIDGHVFAAFLTPSGSAGAGNEDVAEPGEEGN